MGDDFRRTVCPAHENSDGDNPFTVARLTAGRFLCAACRADNVAQFNGSIMKTVNKSSGKKWIVVGVLIAVLAALLVGAILIGAPHKGELSGELSDAVLHEEKRIDLFGMSVNPALISAFVVTAVLLLFALCVRIFAIPRFKEVPNRFQLVIEQLVSFFNNMAKSGSPEHHSFLGGYIFAAGCYIFVGTVFELFGIQLVTTSGHSVSMPAPLSDINAAIAMGFMSYFVILGGGIATNGVRGLGRALKEFSLPVSMSFRLFGALLSGLLVTELVYYALFLSVGVPVIVGVLFTLLHAIIQTYVLTMLTATYFGEVTEPPKPKAKKVKKSAAAA